MKSRIFRCLLCALALLLLCACHAPERPDSDAAALQTDTQAASDDLQTRVQARAAELAALAFAAQRAEGEEASQQSAQALEDAGLAVLVPYETYPSYVISDPEQLNTFWQRVQGGRDASMELVRMRDESTLSYQALCVQGGAPVYTCVRAIKRPDGSIELSDFESHPGLDWQMTELGNFYYRLFPAGDKHYADYQLIRSCAPEKSALSMLERYVLPVDYYYVNLFLLDWSEPSFAGVSFNDLWDRFYAGQSGRQPDLSAYEQLPGKRWYAIPAADFEAVILPYFALTPDALRKLARYDGEEACYPWRPVVTNDMERYDYPAIEPYITGYCEQADGTLTLQISCLSTDIPTDCLFSHELTVRNLPDGSFQYVSNRITYQTELGLPNSAPRLSDD